MGFTVNVKKVKKNLEFATTNRCWISSEAIKKKKTLSLFELYKTQILPILKKNSNSFRYLCGEFTGL